MPAISRGNSARTRRRQASMDNIEDGEPSQRSRAEDVEDDNDNEQQSMHPSRKNSRLSKASSSKSGKKRKLNGKRRGDSDSEEEDALQKTGLALAIDTNNFQDRPLTRGDAPRIISTSKEWEQLKRNMRSSTFQLVEQVAVAMAEAGENKDGEKALQHLEETDQLMQELLDLQAEIAAHETSLIDLANDIARGEEIDNVIQRYTIGVEDRIEAWKNKTKRQKYGKDEDYKKFKSSIYEVQRPDEGMPPLISLIPTEEGDESDDEEIAIGGVSQVYKCPLTLTFLEKPVTSQLCKHTFSKISIEEYLNYNRSIKKKCPASGCSKMICLTDFLPNPELEQKVKAHVRREQRRQAEANSEDEAAEEIID